MTFKEKLEQVAKEYSQQFYGLPEDHSMNDFTSGAKWALDELSKGEGFEKRWIQYEDKYCIETCYPFDPSKANPIETLVDPELDDRPIVEFIELSAITAANAKLELNAEIISARNAEIEKLRARLDKYECHHGHRRDQSCISANCDAVNHRWEKL